MRKLLAKELRLCLNAQVVIFSALSLLVLIPSWPPVVALIYPLSGMITIFPRALANKDIEYTALLPIKKVDVVKGKTLFIVFVELGTLLLATIGGTIRALFFTSVGGDAAYIEAVKPTVSLLGFSFLAFGVANAILLSWYYKDPFKKLTAPGLTAMLVSSFVMAVGQVAIAFVAPLRQYEGIGLWIQLGTLLLGILSFVLLTLLGCRSGSKKFENLDL